VLGWFQRLLPQSGDFFAMFERHSAACVAAGEALAQLVEGQGARQTHITAIRDREHEADEIIRHVLAQVRQTFLTPFDRTAIIGLIAAMDDTIDEIQACAMAIELYDFDAFEPEMKSMAGQIVSALKLIDEALPLLRQITRTGPQLHALTARIVATEGEVDGLHAKGLRGNYSRAKDSGDAIRFVVAREIFQHLEKIADKFEDVANHIDGLAVDHA
jgi:predicted phosphate transport protein (TIGR00153 family)